MSLQWGIFFLDLQVFCLMEGKTIFGLCVAQVMPNFLFNSKHYFVRFEFGRVFFLNKESYGLYCQ